jgi:molybdate transport system regulatory protein
MTRPIRRRSEPAGRRHAGPAGLTLRIDLGPDSALGPGKVRLMELIDELGSIAAAGRVMGMSYRRAWLLVDALNAAFRYPLVAKKTGGGGGGGAGLTRFGREVVRRYRVIERRAAATAANDLRALSAALAKTGQGR